jgi:hypothetical protein
MLSTAKKTGKTTHDNQTLKLAGRGFLGLTKNWCDFIRRARFMTRSNLKMRPRWLTGSLFEPRMMPNSITVEHAKKLETDRNLAETIKRLEKLLLIAKAEISGIHFLPP